MGHGFHPLTNLQAICSRPLRIHLLAQISPLYEDILVPGSFGHVRTQSVYLNDAARHPGITHMAFAPDRALD